MVKLIFKILWHIVFIIALLLTIYFLFEGGGQGIENLKTLFSNGFGEGIKQFFVSIWEGIKVVCNIK